MKTKKKPATKRRALKKKSDKIDFSKKEKHLRLENYTRGWLVGDFNPAILHSKDFEFMVRFYTKGEVDPGHVHKVAHEITVVVSGRHMMNGKEITAGDIIHLEPGVVMTNFECLEDGALAVIKTPSVIGDKYPI